MAGIESFLSERASDLAPTQGQRDAAARSHGYLRDTLATGNMECRIQTSYLSGSYARHTAIRPLDDVDIIFEIDPSHWRRTWMQSLLSQLPSPDRVLETFARAIRYRYPNSFVRTQRRSAGLKMEHLDIDIVPAVVHEQRADWLYVPDRIAGTWIASAPAIHEAVTTSANQACAGTFKPLVRLLKGWNHSLPSTTALRSFAVESIAARVLSAHPQTTLFAGLTAFLDFVSWRGGHPAVAGWRDPLGIDLVPWIGSASLPDIGGTGSNILAGADKDRLVKFCAAARVTRDALLEVARARDVQGAWSRIEHRFRGGLGRV